MDINCFFQNIVKEYSSPALPCSYNATRGSFPLNKTLVGGNSVDVSWCGCKNFQGALH